MRVYIQNGSWWIGGTSLQLGVEGSAVCIPRDYWGQQLGNDDSNAPEVKAWTAALVDFGANEWVLKGYNQSGPDLNPPSPVLVADAGGPVLSEVLDDEVDDLSGSGSAGAPVVGSGGSGSPVEVAAVPVCGDDAGPVLPFAAPTR